MDNKIEGLIERWRKRNIFGFYCQSKEDTVNKVIEIIPVSASIGISGSVTLDQLKLVELLGLRGNKVINQYKAGLNRQESLRLRSQGAQADYYLTSANAVSFAGELVFLSAFGQRIAGISNAKNVIVICGINKLTENISAALKRAKEYAMPLNYKRLSWDAERIMCCQVLIIEAEAVAGRLKVILVGEELGF